MPIKTDEYGNVCVLAPSGDLIGEDCALLRKQVEDQIDKKHRTDFVIDLEKTSFIDSEGLEALLWLKRRAEDLFGQLKLASPDENVRKILEITRLEPRFDVQPDLPTALKNTQ